jgi:hypothetical protein
MPGSTIPRVPLVSFEQHKFGPFGPIRAQIRELAAKQAAQK